MLMLLSSPSLVHADEEALASEIAFIELIDILEFLGETDGLESLGVDLDRLLAVGDLSGGALAQRGDNNEN